MLRTILFLQFISLLFFSCSGQITETYQIQDEKIILKDNPIYAFIKDENGRNLLRIGTNSPVYECFCRSTGECSIQNQSGGTLNCCCSTSCPPQKGMIDQFSGCSWRVAANVSPIALIELARIETYKKEHQNDPFNEYGFRVAAPGMLELKDENVKYSVIKNLDGTNTVEFGAGGPKVQCECTCDTGSCYVLPSGTTITCMGNCRAQVNGNSCDGCGWRLINGVIRD